MSFAEKLFGTFSDRELKKIRPITEKVLALEPTYQTMSDAELQAQTPALKERLAKGETLDDILPDAFAVCREASWRVLTMKHFPVQVTGGIALHRGCIAEMQTGEGKTLVATLPAYLNALSGAGVHIVTVNDYLAKRDSEWMGKLYRWLGLSVGLIAQGMSGDERRAAYGADITYGTNNEFGFDYLRDNMVTYKANMVQRGHAYAIVDEVDSILIDEARTPLIISGRGEDSSNLYQQADRFVRTLKKSVVVELEDKVSTDEQVDGDYVVDEKHKSATLTESGIKKAEAFFKLENLSDPENMTVAHNIDQAIKAHGIMKKDIDYVVKDGQVLIVDEFTGRLMIGRRFNEGLHQAIEAKEGVKIAAESKTLATITFQNFFRMYKKLAGMTGTARTEASEFTEIYGLNIVSIPTNKPCIREDQSDVIYKTIHGKYNAVIQQVMACHEKGQPVLVGTVSVEKSETLAKMLQKYTRDFNVLNAKNHEREAEIVAQAGKKGAITIATNMAGRGTDIMLGGNAEFMAKAQMRKEHFAENLLSPDKPEDALPEAVEQLMAEADGHGETEDANILAARARFDELYAGYKEQIATEADEVRAAGGLFIIGTERHESRRIDNQLRGRSGRQGDPGASRFFLSLEDDLMRLFGGERIQGMMDSLHLDEDTPIENKIITSTLESAQKKLEGRNFEIRKNVLKYDDVMNQQREIIYGQRRKVLDGEDISEEMHKMLRENIDSSCTQFLAGDVPDDWDFNALRRHYKGWLCADSDFHYTSADFNTLKREDLADKLYDRGMQILQMKEAKYGAPLMRELERICLLRNVDRLWMDHIDNMDQLRRGIGLRGYGQKDPVVEYRIEGFDMFDQMIDSIRESSIKMLLSIEVKQAGAAPKREQIAKPTGEGLMPGNGKPGVKGSAPTTAPSATVHVGKKIGRNDPCPCGSGLKWKKCTCREYHPDLYTGEEG
ncbi:MAG: preprotein translocase subunit SecA [Faecalibacterium sp.]|jgi:preprotein translocase subunit SecA|nr:preprotein translocase subunit SecA [Faecalibacterium sp.]